MKTSSFLFSEGTEAENWLKMSYKNDGWFKVTDFELCAIKHAGIFIDYGKFV